MSASSPSPDARPDRIEVPGALVERVYPVTSASEVAEVVGEAARRRAGLLVCAGRTRLHWANPAPTLEAGLCLRGLAGIAEFEPDEGVIQVRAGTPIETLRAAVAAEGWELPLDPSGASSTVGGTLSSAAIGPRAQAFGPVRDAILGLEVVGADGVPSKCGGRVVKNVTGYDLAKLYCGSFGSLAVLTSAWLRLRPAPAHRRVLSAPLPVTREAFEACRALRDRASVRALVWNETVVPSNSTPTPHTAQAPSHAEARAEVVIELGGSAEGVEHDRARIAAVLEGLPVPGGQGANPAELVDTDDDRIDRLRDARALRGGDGAVVVRTRVPGRDGWEMLEALRQPGFALSADPGLGIAHARGPLASPSALRALRLHATAVGGVAIFEDMPAGWRAEFDVFGASSEGAQSRAAMASARGHTHLGPDGSSVHDPDDLARVLKARFDPAGILNPGRFVVGG